MKVLFLFYNVHVFLKYHLFLFKVISENQTKPNESKCNIKSLLFISILKNVIFLGKVFFFNFNSLFLH